MKRTRQTNALANLLLSSIKIVLVTCIATAILVLLLAVSMKWEWLGMERVDTVNTCIKAASACLAGYLASKLKWKRIWMAAGIIGTLYMALSFLIFAILNGSFRISVSNVSDILMAFACASCTCIAAGILAEQFGEKAPLSSASRSKSQRLK